MVTEATPQELELVAKFLKVSYGKKLPWGTSTLTGFNIRKFSTSWEWIMPVVEHIAKNYNVKIIFYDGRCVCEIEKQNMENTEIASFGDAEPSIINVFRCVVSFVKWYNSHHIKMS